MFIYFKIYNELNNNIFLIMFFLIHLFNQKMVYSLSIAKKCKLDAILFIKKIVKKIDLNLDKKI